MAKGENISCVITGRPVYFAASLIEKKAEKFGDIIQFRKHYVCSAARKILRDGYTVDQTREEMGEGHHLPDVSDTILNNLGLIKPRKKKQKQKEVITKKIADPVHRAEIKAQQYEQDQQLSTREGYVRWLTAGPRSSQLRSGGTCHRPDIRLNNEGRCDDCEYCEHCMVDTKKISR